MSEPRSKAISAAKRGGGRARKASATTPGASAKTGAKRTYKAKPGLRAGSAAAVAVEEARQAGWLEGERTEHVSFRAPRALVEAAMREAGVTSPTELGVAALALLAQPDPVAAYFKESFGRLGADFDLAY
jgi:hypothetical protein